MEVREIIREGTGEVLQSKIFNAHSCCKVENNHREGYVHWYHNTNDDISLNDFIRQNSEKIHSIIPMAVGDYGRVMVFYYDELGE